MSARLLSPSGAFHSTQDDREASYWVILFLALRFLEHNLVGGQLIKRVEGLFDALSRTPSGDVGGVSKAGHLSNPDRFMGFEPLQFSVPHLNDMFNELADGISGPYLKAPSSKDLAIHKAISEQFGLDSELADATAAGQYYTAQKRVVDAAWFIKTLRKYADRIPLPLASPNTGDKQYDFNHNSLIDPSLAPRKAKHQMHRALSANAQKFPGHTSGRGTKRPSKTEQRTESKRTASKRRKM